ncbi:chorismate mutase [Paenibacillus lutrae]|uniref:chorismate mutase n=1 Tax=Paenibacillus lutrae TaxID=2078573 RepID=A0A7X3FHX8_9BACL|nr:chorismate mutase [Paenibacillus lutrae]MVP00035.1 chorismate mutase [Paenibacillus lutrae]
MYVRGIRGATTVENNEEGPILSSTLELLDKIVQDNSVNPADISSVFITVTKELTATFPARAIRQMDGWDLVPLMCSIEIDVDNSLPNCIRLMVLVNTEKKQDEIRHVYLKGAKVLRPDIVKLTNS